MSYTRLPMPVAGSLDASVLFARTGLVLRPGDNVRMSGYDNVFTLSAPPAAATAPASSATPTTEEFVGLWYPTLVDGTHISVLGGSVTDGATTYTPTASNLAVHASSLNYVYLECDLTPTTVDGVVVGGVITAAAITSYTTTKTSTNTKGYALLFTWQSSALVQRFLYYSMQAELINSGGNVLFRTWPAG